MKKTSIYILIAISVGLILLGYLATRPSEPGNYISEEVEFLASDGVRISGTWFVPKTDQQARFKTVILIHEFDGDRHDWDPFIPDFIDRGYAILAYDVRGFGRSQSVSKTGDYFDSTIRDVEGAIAWLKKTQPKADADRIAVVGAQLGGTIAYAASAYLKDDVKAAVAISPASDIGSRIKGEGQVDFHPDHIMIQYLDIERSSVQPLIDKAGEPKEVRLYRPDSPAVRSTGLALLHRDLRAFNDLLRYLDGNL